MIRHIVFWKFLELSQEGTRKENLKKAEKIMLDLPGKIEEIVDLRVALNINYIPNACDIGLIITFSDNEGLEKYRRHPAHLELIEFLGNVRYERRVIDYEI